VKIKTEESIMGRKLKEENLEMRLLTDLSDFINALSFRRHRRMFLKTVANTVFPGP